MTGEHPLDNPALSALLGPDAHLGERCRQALRYRPDVSPFTALPAAAGEAAWHDLAELLGPGGVAVTAVVPVAPPVGWKLLMHSDGVQMVDDGVAAIADSDAIPLGPADVPEMLDLVARTRPGPFLAHTIDFGGYLGIRRDGELAAMAGERLHPSGWAEISGVCTDERFRGQGLATRLVRAVAASIRDRGETPFLHVAASNAGAIRLYAEIGFQQRRAARFVVARVPARGSGGPLPGEARTG